MTKILISESQSKRLLKTIISEQEGTVLKYPGDNNWEYKVINGYWYAHKVVWPQDKWVIISNNPKYESSVKRLDAQFPNARPKVQVAGIPTKNTGAYQPNTPDFKTELPTPGFKDPNRFINNK